MNGLSIVVADPLFAAFLAASLVLAATPGPGVLYVVARTASQGRAAGMASVAGVALGNLCNALRASLGLAALLAASSLAFDLIRFAGAAYLVWLGVQALRRPAAALPTAAFAAPRPGRIFRDGFWVALLNPKTALFFAAFLPQFMHPALPAAAQGVLLGTVFVAVALLTDSAYVLLAGAAASRLGGRAGVQAFGRWASAATFIALAVFATVSTGPRGGR